MTLIGSIGDSGLRTEIPRTVSLVGLFEMEIGVLRTESGCDRKTVEAPEIFGEDVCLVLPLVENTAAEVFVDRAVAVGRVRSSGCEA